VNLEGELEALARLGEEVLGLQGEQDLLSTRLLALKHQIRDTGNNTIPGFSAYSAQYERKYLLYIEDQCCGSGHVGSVCFWASWIRIH
jgi:hypothetical protein